MPTWTALILLSDQETADLLGTALERLNPAPTGVAVIEVEDGSGNWEVGGYFSDPPDRAGLALLEELFSTGRFSISKVEDRDWVAQVQRELSPVDAGRFVVHGRHDADNVDLNRVGLRIEAAMAFGTGHHGTTRGCLLLLEEVIRQGARPYRFADIGCGTGVLAMAAARAWRRPGVAADIDPVAVETARANIAANGVRSHLRTATAPGFRSPLLRHNAPYDLIFANILAAPLKRLAPEISRHLSPGGKIILSGLLTSQTRSVLAVYRGYGFQLRSRKVLGEWESLLLEKP